MGLGSASVFPVDLGVDSVDGGIVEVTVTRVAETQRPAQFSPRVRGQEGSEREQVIPVGHGAIRKPQGGPGAGVVEGSSARAEGRVIRRAVRTRRRKEVILGMD